MHHIGYYFGIAKHTEILIFALFGIACSIYDISTLDLNEHLRRLWDMKIDVKKISPIAQQNLKYLLVGIILTKAWSAHLYLASYLVLLWPTIYEKRRLLLTPWLGIGAIRTIGTNLLSLLTGCYICVAHDVFQQPICLDFALSMFIDYGPAFYIWLVVLGFYRELKILQVSNVFQAPNQAALQSEITIRRRKVRSLADGMYFKHHCPIDEDRHLISVSTIENLVQQLTTDLKTETTRSLDSLLRVKAAEAEKEELMGLCEELPNDEAGLTMKEKALKLFKLTSDDILTVKKNLETVTKPKSTKSLPDDNETDDLRQVIAQTSSAELAKSAACKKSSANSASEESETEIGTVLNYSSTSVELKLNEDRKNTKRKKQKKTSDFSCQVNTLSRSVLRCSPSELLKLSAGIKPKEDKSATKMACKLYVKNDIMSFSDSYKSDGYATAFRQRILKQDAVDKNLVDFAKRMILNKLKDVQEG